MAPVQAAVARLVQRSYGQRLPNGIYAECGLSTDGHPVERFLFDPPIPLPEDQPVHPLQITPIEWEGVLYLADWIDGEKYPNVADFVEEVRANGFLWPLPMGRINFCRLNADSRIMLVHGRAIAQNWPDYPMPQRTCLRGKHVAGDFCSSLWWEDLEHGEPTGEPYMVRRTLPSFSYTGRARPALPYEYEPAFIAAFPILRLVVADGDMAPAIAATLRDSLTRLPVCVV